MLFVWKKEEDNELATIHIPGMTHITFSLVCVFVALFTHNWTDRDQLRGAAFARGNLGTRDPTSCDG